MGRRFDPDRAHIQHKSNLRKVLMRIIDLSKYGVPLFYVNPQAEEKYGAEFWDSVENGSWETEQLYELTRLAKPGNYFLDIGASNGVYSLIMASLGCEALAVEPDNQQYRALKTNLELNQGLPITTRNGLVVASTGANLSPYALDAESNDVSSLEQINFINLLRREMKSIIKIDIEGGEWSLLSDHKVITALEEHEQLFVYLSAHIGFFSQDYHKGALHRLKFRLRVLSELWTLYWFARKATSVSYLGLKTTPSRLLRQDRILGGSGFSSQIVFDFSR